MQQAIDISVEELSESAPQSWWHNFVGINKLPFALGFGGVLGLSTPGFDQSWLAWCGLAPLLVLIALCRRPAEALLVGFGFGLGYHLVGLRWYYGLYPLRWMGLDNAAATQVMALLWLFKAAHAALICSGFSWLVFSLPMRSGFLPHYRRPYYPYLLAVPLIWYFMNWVLSTYPILAAIPIDQLAYSQSSNWDLIQLAKLGGPGAVEFVMVMANAAIAACLLELPKIGQWAVERVDSLSPRIGAAFDLSMVLAVVLLVMVWGDAQVAAFSKLEDYHEPKLSFIKAPRLPLAIVQPNITIEEARLKTATREELLKRQVELSNKLPVSMLVWPEGTIDSTGHTVPIFLTFLNDLALREKKTVIFGKYMRQSGVVIDAACLLYPDNRKSQTYINCQPIPIFDWSPWEGVRDQVDYVWRDAIPVIREAFACDTKPRIVVSDWGKIGLSISAEVMYPHLIASEVRDGASLLVNVSDLSWFHNSSLNKQLLATAVFRAVENERYLVFASNTGKSAVINPAGIITSLSLSQRKGTIIDTVQFLIEKTPYSKAWWL
jgi:apolipoprotein N-acyltransferase